MFGCSVVVELYYRKFEEQFYIPVIEWPARLYLLHFIHSYCILMVNSVGSYFAYTGTAVGGYLHMLQQLLVPVLHT